MFRRRVQYYWLPTPFASFPFTSPPVRHLMPSDSERALKRLKLKVRKMYNTRKFGQPYQAELKRLSKELLVVEKKAQANIFTLGLRKRS